MKQINVKRYSMTHLYVYDWAPNGTNDIAVIKFRNKNAVQLHILPEALFGVDVTKLNHPTKTLSDNSIATRLSLKQALKYIAVSPCSDGSDVVEFLKTHFKSLK